MQIWQELGKRALVCGGSLSKQASQVLRSLNPGLHLLQSRRIAWRVGMSRPGAGHV